MGGRLICLSPVELSTDSSIGDLVHDMYWFPDDHYYLFSKFSEDISEDIGAEVAKRLETAGVVTKITEPYFYPHPNPGYANDFVHLPPDQIHHEWQRKASQSEMYVRQILSLEPWKRKQLDIAQTAEATSSAVSRSEPLLEAKPGFAGFSINVSVLWRWLRDRWR